MSQPRKRVGIWVQHPSYPVPSAMDAVFWGICRNLVSGNAVEYLLVTDVFYDFGVVTFETYKLDIIHQASDWSAIRSDLPWRQAHRRLAPAPQIDAILSFDGADAIWEWPLGQLGLTAACFIHDLAPLRTADPVSKGSATDNFKMLGRVVQAADKLLCTSHATGADLAALFAGAAAKTSVVPPGSDGGFAPRAFAPEPQAVDVPRRPPGTSTVLMIGDRDAQSVLAAIPNVVADLGDRKLRVVIIGPSDMLGTTYGEVLARARALAEIVLIGDLTQAELLAWRHAASVLVAPSAGEGVGFSVLEALRAGTPVVASDGPWSREAGGEHVRYCDPYDIEDIARQIAAVLALAPRRRAGDIMRGRAWAMPMSWSVAAARCHRLLSGLPPDKASPPTGPGAPVTNCCLFSLHDLLEAKDIGHFLLYSLLRDRVGSGGVVVVIAIERASLACVNAEAVLGRVLALIDAARGAEIRAMPVGDPADWAASEVEIVAAIDTLVRGTSADFDGGETDASVFERCRAPLHVATLYAARAGRRMPAGLTCDQAIAMDDTPMLAWRPAGQLGLDAAALLTEFDARIYRHGGLARALGWAFEEDVSTLVLAYSHAEYRDARAIAARGSISAIVVLVGHDAAEPGVLVLRHDALRMLIFAARTVVGRLVDDTHLTPELRFAGGVGRRIIAFGHAMDPLLPQLFEIEARPDLAQAMQQAASTQTAARCHYPGGAAIVVAALHALRPRQRAAGIDRPSLTMLLRDPDIQAFGARLKLAGMDGGMWDELVRFAAVPPAPSLSPSPGLSQRPLAGRRGEGLLRAAWPWLRRGRPNVGDANVGLADKARDARAWPAAAQQYRAALDLDPSRPGIWVQYGHALKEQGHYQAAEDAYRRALALDATVADTYLQLGHVLKLQRRTDDAEDAYFHALVQDPSFALPRLELEALGYVPHAIDFGIGARRAGAGPTGQ